MLRRNPLPGGVGYTLLLACRCAAHANHGAGNKYLHTADVAVLVADGAVLGEHVEVLERQQNLEPGTCVSRQPEQAAAESVTTTDEQPRSRSCQEQRSR